MAIALGLKVAGAANPRRPIPLAKALAQGAVHWQWPCVDDKSHSVHESSELHRRGYSDPLTWIYRGVGKKITFSG